MWRKNPTANSPELSEASDGKLLLRVEVRDSERLPAGLSRAALRAAEEAQRRLSIRGKNRGSAVDEDTQPSFLHYSPSNTS